MNITQTYSLKSLSGLDSLTYVGSLQIFGPDGITTYSPLNKLDSINGSLFLTINTVMETMDGFKKLSYIKEFVHWGSHEKLKNLDGLVT